MTENSKQNWKYGASGQTSEVLEMVNVEVLQEYLRPVLSCSLSTMHDHCTGCCLSCLDNSDSNSMCEYSRVSVAQTFLHLGHE
jgi:hypothetical protein